MRHTLFAIVFLVLVETWLLRNFERQRRDAAAERALWAAKVKELVDSASAANDSFGGAAHVRLERALVPGALGAAVGSVTNVLIAEDHIEIHGTAGSRMWFP